MVLLGNRTVCHVHGTNLVRVSLYPLGAQRLGTIHRAFYHSCYCTCITINQIRSLGRTDMFRYSRTLVKGQTRTHEQRKAQFDDIMQWKFNK